MKKIPKIIALSRKEIESSQSLVSNIIISIRSPGSRRAIIGDNCPLDVLWLEFNDVDDQGRVWTLHGYEVKETKLFSEKEAKEVFEFVNKYKNQVELIICQCEAGISRSSGMAAALCTILGDTEQDSEFWIGQNRYKPNAHVYRTMLEAANMSLSNVYKEKQDDSQGID